LFLSGDFIGFAVRYKENRLKSKEMEDLPILIRQLAQN